MDMDELVTQLEELVGVKVPSGTLRRWAYEGLIPGPEEEGKRGRRGRFCNWSREALEQAAVIYTLRHSSVPWGDTKTKFLLAAKQAVDKYYQSLADFCETRDRAAVTKAYLESQKKVSAPWLSFSGKSPTEGYMFGDAKLHPLIVTWIVTLEKMRHGKPLAEPFEVVFTVDPQVVYIKSEITMNPTFEGVTLEPSNSDKFRVNFK